MDEQLIVFSVILATSILGIILCGCVNLRTHPHCLTVSCVIIHAVSL